MTIAFQFITLFAVASAGEPLPMAPPPHHALDELVKEYKRLELPLLPPNAQLVRIERRQARPPRGAELLEIDNRSERYRQFTNDYFEVGTGPYRLAYRVPPATPGDRARYMVVGWFGAGLWELTNVEPGFVKETAATDDAIQLITTENGSRVLALAIQCKVRGWDDLATALYTRAREKFNEEKSVRSMLVELRAIAWQFWALPLTDRGTDRKESYRRLVALLEEEPALRTKYTEWLLNALKLTVAPRTSKPGTVAALIDDLTEYWEDARYEPKIEAETPLMKLAELGFDAVPALIKHLEDDRLTRAWDRGFNNFGARRMTVGLVCSWLLYQLSNKEVGSSLVRQGFRAAPVEANGWFERAKKIGEEKWLLDRALPPDKPIVDGKGCASSLLVRVIGTKYPARLPEVYRAWLKRPYTECWGDGFTGEVVASRLPHHQKIALLEEGVVGDARFRRLAALEGLARLDPAPFRKHLLSELNRVRLWAWLWGQTPVPAVRLFDLTEAADDRACWGALAATGQTIGVNDRLRLIWRTGAYPPTPWADRHRLAHIRFVVQFLDDRDPEICAAFDGVEVRDHAADWLAVLLGFRAERPESCRHPGETRRTLERLCTRAAMRQAAARELAGK